MIGNRVKILREELNLKQEDLAKKLGVSPSAIGMYERDLREANDEIKLKMCDLFECSMDYLTGKSDVRKPEIQNEDLLDLAKVGFTKENYNPPSDKQKEQIRTILETILEDNKKDNKNEGK